LFLRFRFDVFLIGTHTGPVPDLRVANLCCRFTGGHAWETSVAIRPFRQLCALCRRCG